MIPKIVKIETKSVTSYFCNGLLHREDGPAIIYSKGIRIWCKYGKRHRLDGPAVEYDDNEEKEYWLFGKEYQTKEEYDHQLYLHLNDLENYS